MHDMTLDEISEEATAEFSFPDGHMAQPPSELPKVTGVRVGKLVGLKDEGRTPLVLFLGQRGTAAVAARATLDLHGAHIFREVLLMFENGDPDLPIVVGCITSACTQPAAIQTNQVEINADGERLLVAAKERLVLRCGKATITLTRDGKVLIQGTYISSRSSGVNRLKGGSVQLN
jgi:hypothetical protein